MISIKCPLVNRNERFYFKKMEDLIMSLLIMNRNKDEIFFAVDSRESKFNEVGEVEKVHDNSKKVQIVNNQLIFGSGLSILIDGILDDYKRANVKNTDILYLIAKEHIEEFNRQYKDVQGNRLLLIVGEYSDRLNKTVISAIQSDYDKVAVLNDKVQLDCFGAMSKESKELIANNKYTTFEELAMDVYFNVQNEGVGGNLHIYKLTKDSIQLVMRERIKEKVLTHRILSDMIVFTQDNWDTHSIAIDSTGIRTSGKFRLISDGMNGENNLVTIDGNGIKLFSDGTEGAGIEMYNKFNNKTFYLDSNGNIEMSGKINIINGSSGISSFIDAGNLATANNLDDVGDGSTYKRTTLTEKLGGSRAYNSINSSNEVISKVKPSVAMGNPSIQGLFMGSDYLGFHNGNGLNTGWISYIKNDGTFKFKGDNENFIEWTGSELNVRGTINADDIKSGTINAIDINGSNISGSKFYELLYPNNYGTIGGQFGDFKLHYNNNEYFQIRNNVTEVDLKAFGTTFLFNSSGVTYTSGTWNFNNSNLVGLVVKFA